MSRKYKEKFGFAVEGDTEQYYIEWLAEEINKDPNAKSFCEVSDIIRTKDPEKARRRINTLANNKYYYLVDKEKYCDSDSFKNLLSKLKHKDYEKDLDFKLGYSNVSFELWILLHKVNFGKLVIKPDDYLSYINKAFGESFLNLKRYKEEKNFKKLLKKLTINDVKSAIKRAKTIQKNTDTTCRKLIHYGFEYYDENPSLSIHEIVDEILKICKI